METTIKLPKQLKHECPTDFPSFYADENGKSIGTVFGAHRDSTIKNEIITRYNNYPALKTVAITMTVLTGVLGILLFCF